MTSPRSEHRQLHRVRVFVDFWNYTLSMRRFAGHGFDTDWRAIGPSLATKAGDKFTSDVSSMYQGLHFYGSYDPSGDKDQKLRDWAVNTVATFPGVSVSMVPRQRKRPPRCPSCQHEVTICPQCNSNMRGTEEKGVDVRIATDMIRLAWSESYDVAVLVTSDKDLIPAVEFLETRGITVIHGYFPNEGDELAKKCWDRINIPALREELRRS